jgi:hypothetical protein
VIIVSGLLAPPWAVISMFVLWGLASGGFWRIARGGHDPWWYLAVPAGTAATWVVALVVLGALLDWTA